MNLSKFVLNDVQPLLQTAKVNDAQQLFKQLTYSHIPVKDENNVYLGCFSETDARCFDSGKTLQDYAYAIEGFFVRATTNWLDVLEAFAQNSANIIPVLDNSNRYLGYYELNDIINLFNDTPFFAEVGAIVVVEKGINDYTFSEVSQIVESNNGRLLGSFISKIENDVAQITLKIANNVDLNEILQTFRRYSYNVALGVEEDTYLNNLKDRSDYLNKYLNI